MLQIIWRFLPTSSFEKCPLTNEKKCKLAISRNWNLCGGPRHIPNSPIFSLQCLLLLNIFWQKCEFWPQCHTQHRAQEAYLHIGHVKLPNEGKFFSFPDLSVQAFICMDVCLCALLLFLQRLVCIYVLLTLKQFHHLSINWKAEIKKSVTKCLC